MKITNLKNAKWLLTVIVIIFIAYVKFFPSLYIDYHVNQTPEVPKSYWDKLYQNIEIKSKYKVVYVTNSGGEFSYAEHFKFAAERLGWQVKIYQEDIKGNENAILEFDPDLFLFNERCLPIKDMRLIAHRSKKYIIALPPLHFHPIKGILSKILPDPTFLRLLKSSHGIITTCKEAGIYAKIFKKLNKPFYSLRVLPSTPALAYQPAEPKNLMWIGLGWDSFRSSHQYKKFLSLLTNNVSMQVYGYYNKFAYLKNVYAGFIPPGIENINTIRKHGIYLLTHCNVHIKYNSPSVRIFEALAANAIIISDLHPFMLQNFGDSVLYFDQNADGATMYLQVKQHVDWILANPDAAKRMANKANKIFLEKFTLEKDLINIAKMHESVVTAESKLPYSTVYSSH